MAVNKNLSRVFISDINKRRTTYFGKKCLLFLLSVFILSVFVFYTARLIPGDPLVSFYGDIAEKMSIDERREAMERLGLDGTILHQYVRWVKNVFTGNFGVSFQYKQPVDELIADRIGGTLLLGGVSFILLFVFALMLGILCAWFEDRLPDKIICRIGTISSCIPEFYLSLILIFVFAVSLRILPGSGAYTIGRGGDIADRVQHLILPVCVIVTGHLWYYAYIVRSRMLEEVRENYVLLAKSKGLGRVGILFGHCLRNVMPSYLSIMAVAVPHILGGTYIVETVFSYPGIGMLSYESAVYKDYNLLMLLCMLSGFFVIFCSILSQIISERIDPRLRTEQKMYNEMISEKTVANGLMVCEKNEIQDKFDDISKNNRKMKSESAKNQSLDKEAIFSEKSQVEYSDDEVEDSAEVLMSKENSRGIVGGKIEADDRRRFRIVGRRNVPEAVPVRKSTWREGFPAVSAAIIAIIMLACLFCKLIAVKDPAYFDLENCSIAPNNEFLFGTDTLGRDIFSMIWYGGRVSLFIGLVSAFISAVIAIVVGAVSGFVSDRLDSFIMRLTEIFLSVPSLLIIVLFQAAAGEINILSISVVIGATNWMSIAKTVRAEVRRIKNSEYVMASQAMGGGFFHILRRHLMPNFFPAIMFMLVMNICSAITAESTLSFMGIGLPAEIISWGSMLSLSEKAFLTSSWWIIAIPGLFLIVTLVCFTGIGNYVRRSSSGRHSNL